MKPTNMSYYGSGGGSGAGGGSSWQSHNQKKQQGPNKTAQEPAQSYGNLMAQFGAQPAMSHHNNPAAAAMAAASAAGFGSWHSQNRMAGGGGAVAAVRNGGNKAGADIGFHPFESMPNSGLFTSPPQRPQPTALKDPNFSLTGLNRPMALMSTPALAPPQNVRPGQQPSAMPPPNASRSSSAASGRFDSGPGPTRAISTSSNQRHHSSTAQSRYESKLHQLSNSLGMAKNEIQLL